MKRILYKTLCLAVALTYTVVFVVQDVSFAMHSGSTDSASTFSSDLIQATAAQNYQTDLFTGQATTAIPIFVPPGRKGVQPSLALAYSSFSGNGWLGVGWTLDLGSIQRSTKNGVPSYSASDTFLLSFQGVQSELVYISGSEYRPKNESGSFLKLAFDGVSWTAWDKNGTRYSFGAAAASRQEKSGGNTFKWCLDRVTDMNGNYMTVSYAKDNGQIYPQRIAYTGSDSTDEGPAHTVDFLRESRPDRIHSFMSGYNIFTDQRLKQIDVKVGVDLARRYVLNYSQSGRTNRSILTSVTEYGTDGTTALPQVLFAYNDVDDNVYDFRTVGDTASGDNAWNIRVGFKDAFHSNESILLPNGTYWGLCGSSGHGEQVSFSLPFTGQNGSAFGVTWTMDAATGRLTASGGMNSHFHAWTYVYVGSAQTLTLSIPQPSPSANWAVFHNGNFVKARCNQPGDWANIDLVVGWNLVEMTGYNQNNNFDFSMDTNLVSAVEVVNSGQFIQPQLVGDYNGDGMADLADFDPDTGRIGVALSNGTGFVPVGGWILGFGNSNTTPLVGDYNRDGKTDVLMFNRTTGNWEVALSNGKDAFVKNGVWLSGWGAGLDPLVGDFDGDGYLDVGTFDSVSGNWQIALSDGVSFSPDGAWVSAWGVNTTPFTGDFNGDGLTDALYVYEPNGSWYVSFSDGTRFVKNTTFWANAFGSGEEPLAVDANGDGLTDIGFYQEITGLIRVKLSDGLSSFSAERDWVPFTLSGSGFGFQPGDFNGDGLVDPAIFNSTLGGREIALTNISPVDLLKRIENGRGGGVTMTYRSSSFSDNTGSDNTPDLPVVLSLVDEVTTEDGMGNSYTTRYSFTNGSFDSGDREFRGFGDVRVTDPDNNASITKFLQDDIFKGRIENQELQDSFGNKFTRTENTWANTTPFAGVDFVHLTETNGYTYDGDLTYRQTRSTFQYDAYGNPTEVREEGDIAMPGDERTTSHTYTSNLGAYIFRLARSRLYEGLGTTGAMKTEQRFYYDGNLSYTDSPIKGNLTKQENWLDTGGSWLPTTMTYDAYGNLRTVTDARSFTTTNTYDSTHHIYITQIQNTLGHTTQFTYDPKTGQVLTTTDANGQTTANTYDPLGRIVKVVGPLDSDTYPAATYEYNLSTVPNRVIVRSRIEHGQPATHDVYKFIDGIGREIQTRLPAESATQQVVTGVIEFNPRGLVSAQYTPYIDAFSTTYMASSITNKKTTFEYDPAGRRIQTSFPDGAVAQVAYDDWTQTTTDPKGNQKKYFYDAHARLLKVHEFNGFGTYETLYEYDTLGNLTQTTDDLGNITTIQYDSLGRKTAMTDPDMGNWSYAYDGNGNLTSQTDAKGQTITFTYDALNRVTKKQYPNASSVTYAYDTGPNRIGRLSGVSDPSGSTSFAYDVLGRLTQETKTVAGSGSFTVFRTYDALGRLKTLTYPDGEVVTYTYNALGDVETIASNTTTYVTNVDYNAAGQITRINYGNGVSTDYTYDPDTLRLSTLETTKGAQVLQHFNYAFDLVGNVTGITDYVNTATQSFTYDDLNRLISASGSYGTFTYDYNSIGNMTYKEGRTLSYGGPGEPIHAVTSTSDGFQYQYDANGNLTQKTNPYLAATTFTYDYENRLVQVQKPDDEVVQVSIDLEPGLNFISIPLIPEESLDPQNIPIPEGLGSLGWYGDYVQLSRFDGVGQDFEHFVNDDLYDDFQTMEMGRGYQIFINENNPEGVSYTLFGRRLGQGETLQLRAGYTLIGNPADQSLTVSTLLSNLTPGTDYDEVLRYNKGTDSFTTLTAADTVQVGEAVYLHVLRDTSWTLPNGSTTTAFVYDGDGGRVKKIVGTQETVYVGSLYESTGGNPTKYIFLGDQRIASKEGPNTHFYHTDHLGGSNVITDSTGAQSQLLEYTPYGLLQRNEGTEDVEHKFTGQRLDPSTGLYFYNARYYDPELGRFISADTVVPDSSDPQAFNRYSYANNNPVRYTDPTGHGWLSKFFKQSWESLKGYFRDPGDFFKRKIVDPFIAGATAFIFSGGNPVAFMAAFTANRVLDTGEGRQIVRRVGNEVFDDAFGMSPRAAYIASSITLHVAATLTLESAYARFYGSPADAVTKFDPNNPEQTELLQNSGGYESPSGGRLPGGEYFDKPSFGDPSKLHVLERSGKALAVVGKDRAGSLGRGPAIPGSLHTGATSATFPVKGIVRNTMPLWGISGTCQQVCNQTLLASGFSDTSLTLFPTNWSTWASTIAYGNYGGQLPSYVYQSYNASNDY